MYHELFDESEIVILSSVLEKDVVKAISKVMEGKQLFSHNIKEKFNKVYAPDKFYKKYIEIYQM